MMKHPSLAPPRSPGRWMRLALLIAGVGALALIGAALGRGLDMFDSGGPEAQAVGAPAARPLAATLGVAAENTAPQPHAQPPSTQAQANPTASSPSATLTAPARPASQRAGGAGQPMRLPRTGGDDSAPVALLALALFLIGVALCIAPRIIVGRRDEKE